MRSAGLVTSRAALSDALRYFEDAFLVGTVERLSARFGRQRALPREGVRHRSRFGVREFLRSQRRRGAKALEDVVYLELRRRHAQRRTGAIASLKTVKSGFRGGLHRGRRAVGQKGSALYQVSVDASAPKTYDRETRALREAMGERAVVEAYLLTLDGEERDVRVAEGVIREMPVWKWCLQQDQDR